ncbi:MAG: hypothetical protein O2960_30235, partial [Verrucomicrobia bacterium]|nr:hypothetical protein [Verrucomicrobiota bacterium]
TPVLSAGAENSAPHHASQGIVISNALSLERNSRPVAIDWRRPRPGPRRPGFARKTCPAGPPSGETVRRWAGPAKTQ